MSRLQRSVTERPDSSGALPKDTLSQRHNAIGLSRPRPDNNSQSPAGRLERAPHQREGQQRTHVKLGIWFSGRSKGQSNQREIRETWWRERNKPQQRTVPWITVMHRSPFCKQKLTGIHSALLILLEVWIGALKWPIPQTVCLFYDPRCRKSCCIVLNKYNNINQKWLLIIYVRLLSYCTFSLHLVYNGRFYFLTQNSNWKTKTESITKHSKQHCYSFFALKKTKPAVVFLEAIKSLSVHNSIRTINTIITSPAEGLENQGT